MIEGLEDSTDSISTLTVELFSPREDNIPDGKAHGAYMGPIWGRPDPNGPIPNIVSSLIITPVLFRMCVQVSFDATNKFPLSWTELSYKANAFSFF